MRGTLLVTGVVGHQDWAPRVMYISSAKESQLSSKHISKSAIVWKARSIVENPVLRPLCQVESCQWSRIFESKTKLDWSGNIEGLLQKKLGVDSVSLNIYVLMIAGFCSERRCWSPTTAIQSRRTILHDTTFYVTVVVKMASKMS